MLMCYSEAVAEARAGQSYVWGSDQFCLCPCPPQGLEPEPELELEPELEPGLELYSDELAAQQYW